MLYEVITVALRAGYAAQGELACADGAGDRSRDGFRRRCCVLAGQKPRFIDKLGRDIADQILLDDADVEIIAGDFINLLFRQNFLIES